jgi:predicted RNA-binding protein YlqC (UPF0109 family)
MKELVELLVKSLVDHPESVSVQKQENAGTILLEVQVAPDDIGKVIGRQGKVIKSLRSVVRACGVRDGKRINVELAE